MTQMTKDVDRTSADPEQVQTLRGNGSNGVQAKRKGKLRQRLTAWLDKEFDYTHPRRGQVREGVILDVGDNDIIVDIGAKGDGIVPRKDLDLLDKTYRESLDVGDRVPVVVLRTWGREEGLPVSINKGLQQQDWLRAKERLESEQVIEAKVVDVNRGGVLAQFRSLRGFVPNSHLTSIPRGLRGQRLREAKSELVGQILHLVVIEVKPRRRRLVLSERQAQRRRRERLLQELNEGDIRTGTVTNLVDFGAFVDLGGADGLIHISELDWKHVNHPREVLRVGDEVEVYVLSVDRERERIGLSRRRLLPDPWYAVTDDLQPGQVIEGTLTNTADFGAFVDLGQGIEGLIHVSEMPAGKATLAELKPDAPVSVRVLEIDQDRRRLALSLRGIGTAMSAAFQQGWAGSQ